MVSYPDLSNLTNTSGIAGFMSLPSTSYPYFYAWILGGIWLIITFTLYFKEKETKGRGMILSSMSVSSIATMFLSLVGTVMGIISIEIMIYSLVLSTTLIGIWFFSSK